MPDSFPEQNFQQDSPPANTDVPLSETVSDDTLEQALERHGIQLPKTKIKSLDLYCRLLWERNEQLNLTRHTNYEKFVARDLLDSIHLANFLTQGEHLLDVGTGGGVPGVVLAILRPDLKIELCDSTGKKAIAVGEIVEKLKIDIPVWHAKGEDLLKIHRFQTLLVRAVAKMKKLMEIFTPFWHAFDRMLLIKGPQWIAERGESRHFNLMSKVALRKLDGYQIPGTEIESVILQVCLKEKLKQLTELGGAIPPQPPSKEKPRRRYRRSDIKKPVDKTSPQAGRRRGKNSFRRKK